MSLEDRIGKVLADADMELNTNAELVVHDLLDLMEEVVDETGGDKGKFGSLVFDVPLKTVTSERLYTTKGEIIQMFIDSEGIEHEFTRRVNGLTNECN